MKQGALILAAAAVFALIGLGSAARAADLEAGKAKADTCAACHGGNGISRLKNVPSLAGQPAYYLQMQLILFRDKQRIVPQMTPLAARLSDQDTEDLAAYFSSLAPPAPPPGKSDAKTETAKTVIAANHCNACHLKDFSGREQMARLAGQREDYLLKAMRDFKSGTRQGNDATMSEVLYPLKDDELEALAHYLANPG